MTPELGHPKLVEKLVVRIEQNGPIPFAEFMDAALYDPEFGYYTRAAKLGESGDYWTSAEVHSVFGRLVGRQIAQAATVIAPTGEFSIVEMGAGTGTLAKNILKSYRDEHPDLLSRLRYVIIERSEMLASQQQAQLRSLLSEGMCIEWLPNLAALSANSITGVMLSNELVDALPVHRVVKRPLGLREILVGWSREQTGGSFIEVEAPPATPVLERYFQKLRIKLQDGQRTEVNLQAIDWMREVAARLRKGLVLTIDYGHTAADLYSPIRSNGTLLCYHRQTVVDSPYINVGYQDITAHVDFTSLAMTGQEVGLEVTGYTNQLHFLMGLGIESLFAGMDSGSPDSIWMRKLLRPDGMGTIYKVLVQHKAMAPPLLDGLRQRPFFQDALYAGLPFADAARAR